MGLQSRQKLSMTCNELAFVKTISFSFRPNALDYSEYIDVKVSQLKIY